MPMLKITGRIYTGLLKPATTECVLVGDDGRIAATGEEATRAAGKGIEELALGSRVACPGFVDAHAHLDGLAKELTQLALGETRSLDELLARVAEASAKLDPARALFGSGWDESTWPAHELPTRERLDRVAPGRAVVLRRVCGHLWAVNSKALERIAARTDLTPKLRERLRAVSADGLLREDDVALARPLAELSPEDHREGLRRAMRHALALGVTAVHDVGDVGDALREMERAETLPIRVVAGFSTSALVGQTFLSVQAAGSGDRQECLSYCSRVHPGPVKMFLDGSIGAQTAAISFDFGDDPGNRGTLLFETRDLIEELKPHADAGRDIALHAIGDRAIAQALDAFERLAAERGDSPPNGTKGTVPFFRGRRRIEHLEIITPALVARMAPLGVIASMQPNFVGRWQRPGGLYEQRFGWERARGLNPFRSILRAGIPLAFGSDCMPMGPIFGIRSATTHPLESERLTFVEALHAYTLAAARAGGIDRLTGSMEPGKDADIVLLSADGADAKVSEVFVGGRRIAR